MATLDPDALKQFQFLVFTKLEGAVTAGMIHLGDRLGLYRALADADGPLTSRRARRAAPGSTSGGSGSGPTTRRRPRHPSTVDDGEPERFSLTPEGVAVLASPDHEAFGMGMFHRPAADDGGARAAAGELPHRARLRLRQPRAGGGGRHGAQLRAVEPGPPAADRAADARRRRRQAARPAARVADIGCGAGGAVLLLAEAFPASRVRRLRHLPARPRPGRERASAEAGLDNAGVPRRPRATRCRPTTRSTSSRRSTASTT